MTLSLDNAALLQITRTLLEHGDGSTFESALPPLLVKAKAIAPSTTFLEVIYVFTNGVGETNDVNDNQAVNQYAGWLAQLQDKSEIKCVQCLQKLFDSNASDKNVEASYVDIGAILTNIADQIKFDLKIPKRLLGYKWPRELNWNFWFHRMLSLNPESLRQATGGPFLSDLLFWCTGLDPCDDPGTRDDLIQQWCLLAVGFALKHLQKENGEFSSMLCKDWLNDRKLAIEKRLEKQNRDWNVLIEFAKYHGLTDQREEVIDAILKLLRRELHKFKMQDLLYFLKKLNLKNCGDRPIQNIPRNFPKQRLLEDALIPRLEEIRQEIKHLTVD